MSIEATKWAWAVECPSPHAKLILVSLAFRANGEPVCWPSFAAIAKDCGLHRKNIPRYIKQLVEAGLVTVNHRALKSAQANEYVLVGVSSQGGQGVLTLRTEVSSQGGQGVSSQGGPNLKEERKSKIPPLNPPRKRVGSLEGFDEWWKGYPQKVGKGAAERAWPTARKLASLDELVAAIGRYIESKPPDRDWCHPATWLNQKRWLDEPKPNGNGAAGNGLMNYDEPWPQRIRSWRRDGVWMFDQWGPRPGEPGCRAPVSLIDET